MATATIPSRGNQCTFALASVCWLFLCRLGAAASDNADYVPPQGYVCHRAEEPVKVDGRLDDPAWQAAAWTEDFVDIEGDKRPKPRFRTRAKMLWDDEYFYIAAEMEEPHVWGTLTKHDSVIFHDNDFEVFVDPDGDNHNYGEFEINALNTGWDLRLPKPYKDGGPAEDGWEIPGLKTAVHIVGTLNDPSDEDRTWSVELAFPWEVLGKLKERPEPPVDGEQWRVNFSRVEWRHEIAEGKYKKIEGRREDNWVWSPQGVIDMHRPETWGYVQFSTAPPGEVEYQPDAAGPARHALHRAYYAQRDYHAKHKRYAGDWKELGFNPAPPAGVAGALELTATDDGYEISARAVLPDKSTRRVTIRQDSLVQ